MIFNFDNERPIYIQIVEGIKKDIVSGVLKPGERILSVREYALNAKVNPNTMQKALMELEREKLIYTERTNGKYITTDKKIILKLKQHIVNEKLDKFFEDMKSLGIDENELRQIIKEKGKEC